jgi:NAD+ synthase (glutamine-hydrolysing)
MRIALLQINPTVGALEGNSSRIVQGARNARSLGADLVVTPELALTGYPPRDLLMHSGFIERSYSVLRRMALEMKDAPAVLVGAATMNASEAGRPLYNSAVLLRNGILGPAFHKTLLPTYDVFDEDRYFEPAHGPQILVLNGTRVGVSICEDLWNDRDFWRRRLYHRDPVETLADAGAEAIVNLSASPFARGKHVFREKMFAHTARKYGLPVLWVNQVGGNDDLIFDGRSAAWDREGQMFARAASFREDLLMVDLAGGRGPVTEEDGDLETEVWNALVLGVRDYVRKTGFRQVLLGLSGGIDSAVTAAIAADAVDPQNVLGVLMPSIYSSDGSVTDSLALANNLGIKTVLLPISGVMKAYDETLGEPFAGLPPDVTEENIQARIRGTLLMALSNKFGSLLLTTGNKSELAVGYCRLYGDMNGGLAVIADVPKTMVYRLARWRNQRKPDLPDAILTKTPSAELRPGQTDQDSLPPYEILDQILELHINQSQSAEAIISHGFDHDTVRRVLRLVRAAEFKRKQAAPALKVSSRAFGTGWRMPIAEARFWSIPDRGRRLDQATRASFT